MAESFLKMDKKVCKDKRNLFISLISEETSFMVIVGIDLFYGVHFSSLKLVSRIIPQSSWSSVQKVAA